MSLKTNGGYRLTLESLWSRYRGRCHLCGGAVPLHAAVSAPDAPTRDHAFPRGYRRRHGWFLLAHYYCNQRRANLPLEAITPEFKDLVRDELDARVAAHYARRDAA